jgi:bacillolysin
MRYFATLLIALFLFGDTISNAGESKHASASGKPSHFKSKEARQIPPEPDQLARFTAGTAQLAKLVAAKKRIDGASLPVLTPEQVLGLDRLQTASHNQATIEWDYAQSVPVFIRGLQSGTLISSEGLAAEARSRLSAREFFAANAGLLRVADPVADFREIAIASDDLGYTHLRFQQYFRGVEVWGRDVRVHVAPDGCVESFNGRYVATQPIPLPESGAVEASQAEAAALSRFGSPGTITGTRQVYLPSDNGSLTRCWLIGVTGTLEQHKDIFVDAATGTVAKVYNRVVMDGPASGSGVDVKGVTRSLNVYQIGSTYYMIDATKAMFNAVQSQFPNNGKGVIYAFDARNTQNNLSHITSGTPTSWSVAPGVAALYTGAKVYDFFKTVYNRNAIDGQGSTMNLVVNYGNAYNNAFWNGQYMVFGNGNGVEFSDLSGGADVAAHEMTHGITEWTAALLYENQPGALNESFSDVFGTLFEFWLKGVSANWLMGEDVFTPGTPGDALRSMSDPGGSVVPASLRQPSTMSQYVNLPNTDAGDNGGVHTNSGIPNKAFYLFATAAGMTKEDAGLVYYRALTTYLTKNAQFVDCRLAVIKAAEDLFGGVGNAKALAAVAAFDAVGITGTTGTPDPPTEPTVQGTRYLALIEANTGKLYRWTVGTSSFTQLTSGALYSRPAVTDEGDYLYYVDTQKNLHLVRSDGTGDQALSSTGGFNNIAISRSGRYLAATTVYSEPNIYIFDLQSSAGDKVLHLYTPTYNQGETAGNIRYPDRIDWTFDESRIMYDAFNTAVLAGGDTLGYWDLNTVRVSDGDVSRFFPLQPRGVDIGNAVFASNTDNLISLDYIDASGQAQVRAVNLNTGNTGIVTYNGTSPGSPTFSVDDKKIYYHYIDESSGRYEVWSAGLAADGITGLGDDSVKVNGGVYPLAFAIGARTTGVPAVVEVPERMTLEQNYPNPFNPTTKIGFGVSPARLSGSQEAGGGPGSRGVRLVVCDLLGREVAVLVNERKEPGSYQVQFDGSGLASGVYFLRLSSGSYTESKKMLMLR